MSLGKQQGSWFRATLMLSSLTISVAVFGFWELVENRFFRNLDYLSLHYLYISRGLTCSLFLAIWAAWFVMSQRRRSEEQLRRSHERYRGLLDASPTAMALLDANLTVCEWNVAAEKLYGYSQEEVLEVTLPTIRKDYREELERMMQVSAKSRVAVERDTRRFTKSGKIVHAHVALLPYSEHGKAFFLEATTDIGEHVRLRERLVEFEKITAIGNMAAGTAHHLNTPLATMLLRVQMMKDRIHTGRCAGDLEHIENSLRFCQGFVRQLLDFSRHSPAQKQPETLSSIVKAAVGFMSPSFSSKGADVQIEVSEPAADLRVFADRNQLETVLLILLSNSLDAISGAGQIALQVTKPSREVLQVTIEDDGVGIPQNVCEHLFEPFFTTKPSGKGTGLGLALAKNIINEHRGVIEVTNRHGCGAIATFTLPIHKDMGEREAMV